MKKFDPKKFQFSEPDVDGARYLLPQMVKRHELAFFYGKHPSNFIKELELFLRFKPKKKYWTSEEVAKIIARIGRISDSDVKNAKERIETYLIRGEKRRKRRIFGTGN